MKLERIQILRFCAATAVLAYHGLGTLANHLPDPGTLGLLRHGDYGVDLFFVISGFIIQLTVRSRERDWRVFARRRLWRVVPLYWICTLALWAMLPVFAHGATPSPVHLLRSLAFLAWTAAPGAMPVIYPGWSLEYELFFYGLAAAAMAAGARPWRIVCWLLAALAIGGALAGVVQSTGVLGFFVNPILLEFTFGVLIGEGLARRHVPWTELVPVAIATLAVLRVDWGERVWIAGVPSAALVLGAAMLDARAPLRSRAALAFAKLGDASYSIYLAQVFSISPLVRVGVALGRRLPFEAVVALIVAGGLVGGWLLYVAVERPLQRVAHRRTRRVKAGLREEVTRAKPASSDGIG